MLKCCDQVPSRHNCTSRKAEVLTDINMTFKSPNNLYNYVESLKYFTLVRMMTICCLKPKNIC